ncbi:MAG: hypothetical protein QXD89_01610, partial [Candidatus Aenigmatarchaeota archaeon]
MNVEFSLRQPSEEMEEMFKISPFLPLEKGREEEGVLSLFLSSILEGKMPVYSEKNGNGTLLEIDGEKLHDFINLVAAKLVEKEGYGIKYDEKNPEVLEEFLDGCSSEVLKVYEKKWDEVARFVGGVISRLNWTTLYNDGGSPGFSLCMIGNPYKNYMISENEENRSRLKKLAFGFLVGALALAIGGAAFGLPPTSTTSTKSYTSEKSPEIDFKPPKKPGDVASFCVNTDQKNGTLIFEENSILKEISLTSSKNQLCANISVGEGNYELVKFVLGNNEYYLGLPFSVFDDPNLKLECENGLPGFSHAAKFKADDTSGIEKVLAEIKYPSGKEITQSFNSSEGKIKL